MNRITIQTKVGKVHIDRDPQRADRATVRYERSGRAPLGSIIREAQGCLFAIPCDGRERRSVASGREAARWLAEGHRLDADDVAAARGDFVWCLVGTSIVAAVVAIGVVVRAIPSWITLAAFMGLLFLAIGTMNAGQDWRFVRARVVAGEDLIWSISDEEAR
jgi:hypothetical protein